MFYSATSCDIVGCLILPASADHGNQGQNGWCGNSLKLYRLHFVLYLLMLLNLLLRQMLQKEENSWLLWGCLFNLPFLPRCPALFPFHLRFNNKAVTDGGTIAHLDFTLCPFFKETNVGHLKSSTIIYPQWLKTEVNTAKFLLTPSSPDLNVFNVLP